MKIGYARVSTLEQSLDLQLDALKEYGCDRIYSERGSTRCTLPERDKAIDILMEGDTLVVWKLDRFGRSTIQLLSDVSSLIARGVNFVSLQDNIDTSSAMGRFQMAVFSAIAELERDIIRERTIAGLEAARLRGRVGGRPRGQAKGTLDKIRAVETLVMQGANVSEACRIVKIAKSTYYQFLKR